MKKAIKFASSLIFASLALAWMPAIAQSDEVNLEKEKLALERERLALERERLALEAEKLELGKGKKRQKKQEPENPDIYKNFTAGQRWTTWGLNLAVPGLGSWLIMKDGFGGFVNLGLGIAATIAAITQEDACAHYYAEEGCYKESDPSYIFIASLTWVAWNSVRSATYDKPQEAVLTIAPIKNGNTIKPGLFYNVKF
jgi:hypothetical protein